MPAKTVQIPTNGYLSVAQTAILLRAALKKAFPAVKFSVRSQSYSGGASIDVRWTDGPVTKTVDEVTRMYAGATFDGMTDMKSYHSTPVQDDKGDIHVVKMGADFVFTNRDYSPEFLAQLEAKATEILREPFDAEKWFDGEGVCTEFGIWRGFGRGHEFLRYLAQYIAA